MQIETLKDLYLAELQEARSVEAQLADALPKMIARADASDLTKSLQAHLEETQGHLESVDAILKRHDAEPRAHRDQSMQAILSEAEDWVGKIGPSECCDAALVASAQRIEHYEMAIYGTLASWATLLNLDEDAQALQAILEEEKAADAALTQLAKGTVNRQAVAAA